MSLASKAEDREVRELLSLVEEAGWDLKRTTNGHFKIYPPGQEIVYMAGKVGDPAGFKNAVARLKRAGLFKEIERIREHEQPIEEDLVLIRLEEAMNQKNPEEPDKSGVDEHTIRIIELGRLVERIHSACNENEDVLKKVVDLLREADKLGVTMLEVATALQKKK